MTYTNSFHHGTERVPGHNRRTLQGEAHIDPNGKHEIWKDEKLADAYDRIFGEALQEYNAKQKRADRKIKSYLQNVRQNSKLNDCYEFIAQVGNEKSHPEEPTCHAILKAYFEGFSARNPGLEVIGGYYHADEVGGCPHIHVDYIPTAPNKKTGLKLKNNLTEALKKLGYETEYVEDTDRGINKKTGKPYTKMVSAEMKFQEAEREALTEICRQFGIEIENPKRSKDEYCTSKQLRQARDVRMQNEARSKELELQQQQLQGKQKEADKILEQKEEVEAEKKSLENSQTEANIYALKNDDFLPPLPQIESLYEWGSPETMQERHPILKKGTLSKESHYEYADRQVKEAWKWIADNFYKPLKDKCSKLLSSLKTLKQENALQKDRIDTLERENKRLNEEVDKIVDQRLKERSEALQERVKKPLQDKIDRLHDFIFKKASFKHSKDGHEIIAENGLLDMAERCDNWRHFNQEQLREIADDYDRYGVSDNNSLQEAKEKARKIKPKSQEYGGRSM